MLKVATLSKSALNMLVKNCGYRSDDYSDTNIIASNMSVLDHEINDLENDDIVDFMEDHYGLEDNVERNIDNTLVRDEDGYVVQNKLVSEIDERIKKLLHSKSYDLIWLCDSPKNVLDSDYAETKDTIYKVDLPKNAKEYALLSDLDKQGCLFAYVY